MRGTETGGSPEVLRVRIEEAGYDDKPAAIRNIAFSVRSGELAGLIGPNGAGKSTTIKAIMGLLREVRGQVELLGEERSYSFIPEHPVLYEELTLWEHLELAAAAHGLTEEEFRARAETLLVRFRLDAVRHEMTSSFSKGMQQKTMLALGFLVRPNLYILDEPFIGLDPKATKDLLDLLEEERQRGAGILMSTHVLDTAERICDSFVLIDGGEVAAQGTLEEVRRQAGLPGASLFDCFHTLT